MYIFWAVMCDQYLTIIAKIMTFVHRMLDHTSPVCEDVC